MRGAASRDDRSVLVAPDSFKGTFDAAQVAEALGRGLGAAGLAIDLCPVADGGEGTQAALLRGLGGESHHAPAHDPLGRPLEAGFGFVPEQAVGIVETAAASGLGLVAPDERDAWAASTAGTGELIAAAVRAGARTLLVGVGGSATTDGGAGALAAIEAAGGLGDARVVVLCDVRTPYERAAELYAAQKGADEATIARLTARLQALAGRLPRDPRGVPMSGCAGGLSGALWAALGAELVPGAGAVLGALDFDARLRAARAVVTGEGRLDRQTAEGKLIDEIARRAGAAGVPVHAVAGELALDAAGVRALGLRDARTASTLAQIEEAGAALGRALRGDA
jgi:glycerate kinase